MGLGRRALLRGATALGLASTTLGALGTSRIPLKILILGGTGFLGPHMVRYALSRGHELTLFNRGRTGTHLFPEVTRLLGDRDNGLDSLATGEWDVVLDNSGYVPRHVRDSAQLLKGRVGRYLFTSTVSVYDFAAGDFPLRVGSPLAVLTEPDSEDTRKHYGALKVLCEQAVRETYGAAATVVRPTFVVGPGDHTQRFTWWVARLARGGDVLAPGNPQGPASLIDVRDLARFVVTLLEDGTPGTFNAAGPAGQLSFGGMLAGIRATRSTPVSLHWADAAFLEEHGVRGNQTPLWIPGFGSLPGQLVENATSIDAGLRFTPLAETAAATLAWHESLPVDRQVFTRSGLDPEREKNLIEALQKPAPG